MRQSSIEYAAPDPGTPSVAPAPDAVRLLDVFVAGPGGGNPVALVGDASQLTDEAMQAVARSHGCESAFVLPPTVPGADWRLRFFLPQHEMEMCGHATVGTLWALRQWGRWTRDRARLQTPSGLIDAYWDEAAQRAWISQPGVAVEPVPPAMAARIARILRLPAGYPLPDIVNASTSRVKTLVRLPDAVAVDALGPDFDAMEELCSALGSTGLYPYAIVGDGGAGRPVLAARQFPKSAGYPEDAATGVAAAALWGYLASHGTIPIGRPDAPVTCVVRQGEAMGRPSAIAVRARFDDQGKVAGCWIGGEVAWAPRG